MSLNKRKGASVDNIIGYTLPKLHTGKNWYIDFKAFDPLEQTMKRKKYMLDGIDKLSERKQRAAEVITNLTNQLRTGWNPWADTSNSRQYTQFIDIIQLYYKYITKLYKSHVFKETTFLDYKKRIKMLAEYNEKRLKPIIYIYQFDKTYVSDFLDYILIDRDSSARTRNNYRTWLSSFSTWLSEKQYIDKNPVEDIKSLTEDTKKRSALAAKDLQKLRTYLQVNNPHFLLLCQFEYYTLIRPDELSNIKLRDIHLKEQKIFIAPGTLSFRILHFKHPPKVTAGCTWTILKFKASIRHSFKDIILRYIGRWIQLLYSLINFIGTKPMRCVPNIRCRTECHLQTGNVNAYIGNVSWLITILHLFPPFGH